MAEVPLWLPAKGLAILFGVSEQRISQMKRKGQLKPDARNWYSVQQAKQLRDMQMTEHGVRVVAQSYGNGTGKVSPPKIVALNEAPAGVALSPEDREALSMEVDPTQVAASPHSVVAAVSKLNELRERKIQLEIDRGEIRRRKEAGELVERAQVQSAFVEAGALIANILQNLPAEVSSIFADPEKKAEVRLKVQTRIDQCQHALYASLRDKGEEDAG